MSNNTNNKKQGNNKKQPNDKNSKVNPLLIGAAAIVVIAFAVIFLQPKGSSQPAADSAANTGSSTEATADAASAANTGSGTDTAAAANSGTVNENGDLVINTADITDQVSFFEYDANGTTVGLLAVKTSDGTIHTALNTCQVCNGSPYAYFEQQGDTIQCQNCGNTFNLDEIGQERGGCNPIPITDDDKTVSDSQITIAAKYLSDSAAKFGNWKQF